MSNRSYKLNFKPNNYSFQFVITDIKQLIYLSFNVKIEIHVQSSKNVKTTQNDVKPIQTDAKRHKNNVFGLKMETFQLKMLLKE